MEKGIIKSICFVDETFVDSFPNYKKFIKKIVKYLNKKIPNEFLIKHKIKRFSSKKIELTWDDYYKKELKKHKNELKIMFIDKGFFKIKPIAGAVTYKNNIIVSTIFPLKIPFFYKMFLKRVVLHEMGHIFGLGESIFVRFSIMDYGCFLLFPRFTKSQKEEIKKYLNQKKKIGYYLNYWKFDFPFFFTKKLRRYILSLNKT